jgi:hypothetical protein
MRIKIKHTRDCGQAKPNGRIPKNPDIPKNMSNPKKKVEK